MPRTAVTRVGKPAGSPGEAWETNQSITPLPQPDESSRDSVAPPTVGVPPEKGLNMKSLTTALFGLLLVSAVVVLPGRATADVIRWEYRTSDAGSLATLGGWDTDGAPAPTRFPDPWMLKGLNKLGEEGWEVVNTLPGESSGLVLLLKRPKP